MRATERARDRKGFAQGSQRRGLYCLRHPVAPLRMAPNTPRRFTLAGWLVEADLNRVSRGGEVRSVEPKVIEVLCRLAASAGELVTRETLLQEVWRGRVVVDQVLTRAVGELRTLLGDDPQHPRIIETVPRRGYRLLAAVEAPDPTSPPTPSAQRRRRRHRWLGLAAAVAVLALLGGWLAWRTSAPPLRSVAVLPFKVLTRGELPAYYAEGLAESLITALSQMPELRVIARGSAFGQEVAGLPLPQVGERLDVEAVVLGSVQEQSGALRATVRLVRVRDGRVLWAGDAQGLGAGEWFAMQDRVVAGVLAAMGRSAESLQSTPPTASTAAHRHYLRGRHLWNRRTPDALREALPELRRALDADPGYAQAHAALAQAYVLQPFYGLAPPREAMPRARAAARAALALDADLGEAHAVQAVVLYQFEHDWAAAAAAFERALAASPNDATLRQWYAEFLGYAGRFEASRAQIEWAAALDPLSPVVAALRGSPDLWAGHCDAALPHLDAALEFAPDFPLARYAQALCHRAQGRLDEAITIYRRLLPQLGEGFVLASLANAEAARGDATAARRHAQTLARRAERRYVPPYKFAVVHAGLGEMEAAFAWLERAYQARDERLVLLDVDVHMDPLRNDPRFADLRRRVGLPAKVRGLPDRRGSTTGEPDGGG